MKDDINRNNNVASNYTCTIRDSTFVCYHTIDDTKNDVKITITITEEGNERKSKRKED